MLASVTDGSVTSTEALHAASRVNAGVAAMVAVIDIERTPTEELREIMHTCAAFSARLAELEERTEAMLAVVEHQGGDDAAVA